MLLEQGLQKRAKLLFGGHEQQRGRALGHSLKLTLDILVMLIKSKKVLRCFLSSLFRGDHNVLISLRRPFEKKFGKPLELYKALHEA